MRTTLILSIALFVLALGSSPAFAGKHKDENLGYSLVYPKKWTRLKFGTGSDYVVARFESDREYEWSDKDGFYTRHKPHIEVVVIPLELANKRGAVVEKTEDGVTIDTTGVPWKNVKEYLEAKGRGIGGFFFSREEETEVRGMKVIKYEVTVDKLVRGPRRLYGWAFYTEDAIYGVVGELLIDKEKKLKPMIFGALKSFRTFARRGSLPGTSVTGGRVVLKDGEKEKELTEEQKKEKRRKATAKALVTVKEATGRGWMVKETKNFIAVSHADAKYTMNILNHAEALRAWLVKNMDFVGKGYVGKVILTICEDGDERSDYLNAKGWSSDAPEVVTFKDREGWSDWAMESLNRGIFNRYLKDKNPDLYWGAPAWIDRGMLDFIESARSKGRRIEFKPDTYEASELKTLRRDGKLLKAKDFFSLTSEQLWGEQQNWIQAQYFVQFLLIGSGSKASAYKTVFRDYMGHLIAKLEEEKDKEDKSEGRKEPASEEEEDQQYKDRQNSWRKKEKEVLQDLFRRCFGSFTDKDWDKFTQLFWRDCR